MKHIAILITWLLTATWLVTLACSYSFLDLGRSVKTEIQEVGEDQAWQDSAQAGFGTIRGIVKDEETGEGIPDVSVMTEDTEFGAASQYGGDFLIKNIPPGKYTLIIKTIGYNPIVVEDLSIGADETIEMEVRMQRHPVTCSIGDWIRPPLINRYQTSNQKTIEENEIEAMPASTANEILKKTQGFVR